jgi:hypothetical protein
MHQEKQNSKYLINQKNRFVKIVKLHKAVFIL